MEIKKRCEEVPLKKKSNGIAQRRDLTRSTSILVGEIGGSLDTFHEEYVQSSITARRHVFGSSRFDPFSSPVNVKACHSIGSHPLA